MLNITSPEQIDGPAIIDSEIKRKYAADFTLESQNGSKVRLGTLQAIPIGQSVLWVQAVVRPGRPRRRSRSSATSRWPTATSWSGPARWREHSSWRSRSSTIDFTTAVGPLTPVGPATGTGDTGSTGSGSDDGSGTGGTGTGSTTTPSGSPQTVEELLAEANRLYAEAKAALQGDDPDFATYDANVKRAFELVAQAEALAGGTTSDARRVGYLGPGHHRQHLTVGGAGPRLAVARPGLELKRRVRPPRRLRLTSSASAARSWRKAISCRARSLAMRTWLVRSSSTSSGAVGVGRVAAGGSPRGHGQLLQPLLLCRQLAGDVLMSCVELVAHLHQLVGELRGQLLEAKAEPLVVAELAGVEAIDPLAEAADQVLHVGQRRAGRGWSELFDEVSRLLRRRWRGRLAVLELGLQRLDLALELGDRLGRAAAEAHEGGGLPTRQPGDTVLTPTRRGVEQSGSSSGS